MFVTTGLNDVKERLSVAYLAAVTARAGYQISHLSIDKQSIDATVRPITGLKLSVDFQLKATSASCVKETNIIFDLPSNNYNHLVDVRCTALHYLMVLVLPQDEETWLMQNEQNLVIASCGYWIDLRGKEPTTHKESVRVYLPREQILDASALQAIMQAAYQLASPATGGFDAR